MGNKAYIEKNEATTPYYPNDFMVRPSIATDAESNAYIIYTEAPTSHWPNGSAVMFSKIAANTRTPSTPVAVTGAVSDASHFVTSCDIATWLDSYGINHVFVLWRKTKTDYTRNLYLSESTDGGSSWATHNIGDAGGVTSGLPLDHYDDYPCLAISSGCGTDSAFVVYTRKRTYGISDPSDIYLTSASLTVLGSWKTPYRIEPHDPTSDDDNFKWTTGGSVLDMQWEPAICADGAGGAFITYYSDEHTYALNPPLGSPKTEHPRPVAMLFETGFRLPQQAMFPYAYDGFQDHLVDDYIGMVFDGTVAHAVWTDYSGTGDQIYTKTIAKEPLPGSSEDPELGDLGFSNQRRIVMTGNTAHVVGFGSDGQTGHPHPIILYSEQTAIPGGGVTKWSTPFQLDGNAFADYDNRDKAHKATLANCTPPSVGVYESGGSSGQKAVAVVWQQRPPGTPGGVTNISFLHIRVKEFDDCYEGEGSWVVDDKIPINVSNVQSEAAPVVAPLTVPISWTSGVPSKDRYLIGWVLTFPKDLQLQSRTYLRGGQTTSVAKILNQDWGIPYEYSGSHWAPASENNLLVDDSPLPNPPQRLTTNSFVSTTSNESNWNGITSNLGDATQEIVFSGDGVIPNTDVWDVKASYVTTVSPTLGSQGTNLGEAALTSGATYTPKGLDSPQHTLGRTGLSWTPWKISYDRNPCVTITSTGQKIVAFEHIDGFAEPIAIGGVMGSLSGTGGIIQPCLPVFNYASIRTRKTKQDGSWDKTVDIISASANAFNWAANFNFGSNAQNDAFNPKSTTHIPGWLRNPNITAFPKNSYASSVDPGAAELLFWQEQKTTIAGCTATVSTANLLHERRFWQQSQGHWWSGDWQDFDDPKYWGPYYGTNSQRSIGVYNNGPQWPSSSVPNQFPLVDRNGNPYNGSLLGQNNRGLTYGIGNSTTGSMYTIATADVGAYKMGTFDTALSVQLYRSETRVKDSSMVMFKWGKVYVEDTTLGLPTREVMLHNGIPDSTGFASNNAIRDSLFATEWFNWPVSAQIKYDRLMFRPVAGYFDTKIDTNVIYDTVGDSTFVYDTLPGTFHADSTYVTDSSFFGGSTKMKYTVELVHQSGHIDTVEQMMYKPIAGLYIHPRTVHIANAGTTADTVLLRVRGDFTGIPEDDSLVGFARETMLDTYPSYGDTTIAIGTGGGKVLPPPDSCFYAIGPYPNPSWTSAGNVSILVHFCGASVTINAQVYDVMGTPVGSAVTFTSDGQVWDRLDIPAPTTAGAYYIHVSVVGFSTVLSYVVD